MPAVTKDAALEPVQAAMVRQASERADQILARARDGAHALIARASQDADAAIAKSRADGAAQAGQVAAAELNRSRRAARSAALGAELTTRDELAGRIRAAVGGLRDEAGYPGLRDRLAGLAARLAGPGAVISENPAGGVIARADGVVVDCSLPRLADRAIEVLSARIAGMCGP